MFSNDTDSSISLLSHPKGAHLHTPARKVRSIKNQPVVNANKKYERVLSAKSTKTGKAKSSKAADPDAGDENSPHDDIMFIARCLADPLGEITPESCGLSADFNGDGIVDLEDLRDVLAHQFTIYSPEELAPLWPTMIDDAMAHWPPIQPSSTDGRRHLSNNVQQLEHIVPAWTNEHRELQPTCGLGVSGRFGKGDKNNDPSHNWTNDYPYDPDFELNIFEAAGSFIWYATYFYGIPVFFAGQGWTEAAAAWIHYTTGLGTPRETDYEVAYNEDSYIKAAVDQEIEEVKRAVKELHGDEGSFEFYSTKTRAVSSDAAGEYQAVLGGHQIWSSGTVSYDQDACLLQVDITIKAEDFYDFNVWDGSYGDMFVNLIPGAFASLGWAIPFITTGQISRTETIDLNCCKDEDCGDSTEFDCECNLCTAQCPTQQNAGGYGRFQQFTVDLHKTQGVFQVYYQMYTIPDQLKIYYEGVPVFSTGGLVSGSRTVDVSYGSATSTATTVTVEVDAPDQDTAWVVSVSCPP